MCLVLSVNEKTRLFPNDDDNKKMEKKTPRPSSCTITKKENYFQHHVSRQDEENKTNKK